jgi:tRNA(Ile)-lysidine synthase
MMPSNQVATLPNRQANAPLAAHPVLRALLAAQAHHRIFPQGAYVIVAVSGGADSMALLHALHHLAPLWEASLYVAHVNHNLRPEAAEDAAFVAGVAARLALPCHIATIAPGTLDDDPRGPEEAARSARYTALRAVASELAAQHANAPITIATAHHLDDQAETLLLHLLQGSGLAGLAGMAWVGDLPDSEEPSLRLVRPLLGLRRDDLHAYLRSYGLTWREDSSNLDTDHPRNFLRHNVLPLLARVNPNIHATLARTAELLAAEADHAQARDQAALAASTYEDAPLTRIVLDWFHLAALDLATQRGVLRHALVTLGIDGREVGMEGIDTLLEMAYIPTGGPHPLVAGWVWTPLRAEGKSLLALHRADALPITLQHPHLVTPLPTPLSVPAEGMLRQQGWHLHSTHLAPDALPPDWRSGNNGWHFLGDAEMCGDLRLTTPHAGMRMAPLGMGGHTRAVGDIFTDHKIHPTLRAGWPVVINSAGHVIWLCGLTVADHVRVRPTTECVRVLRWQRAAEAIA